MNDRVVDRAAAHATPAELAVRDWLLVGLSLATGMYAAICFLSFGKVFTAAMTGNLVLLGIGAAGTHQPAGPNAVTVVISLAAFAAGVALAVPILKAFSGDQETENNHVFPTWPRRVSIALAIAFVLQLAFVAVSAACRRADPQRRSAGAAGDRNNHVFPPTCSAAGCRSRSPSRSSCRSPSRRSRPRPLRPARLRLHPAWL